MKKRLAGSLAALLLLAAVADAQPRPPQPKIEAKLLAANASLAPGGSTDVIIRIDVSKGWHIYHPITLGTGVPTSIRFEGPSGVSVDPVLFPTPELSSMYDIEYLGFEGSLSCLTTIHASPEVKPGRTIKLTAKVAALACIEECVNVSTTASISLPVTETMGAEVNADALKEAREAMPPALKDAEFITGSEVSITKPALKPGEEAEVVATIRVKDHHHIQDRDPGIEDLIASRLFIEQINGIEIADEEDQIWPKAKSRDMPGLGTVREQSGEFKIRVPIKLADAEFPAGDVRLRVLFQYQCCTDEGQCFAPQMAVGSVTFRADTGEAADPEKAEYTATESAWSGGGAPPPPTTSKPTSPASQPNAAETISTLLVKILLAFLGGMILNVTPCVLPVISIKVLSFVQQAGEDRRRILNLGLAFCAGIMAWFWLFAGLSMAGHVPLQYPWVVVATTTVLFVLALNMFGVFEIILPGRTMTSLDVAASREGYSGAFLKGFLATLLGTACTAPFLAGALVYAATQPRPIALAVFTSAGLGMSAPYLLLTAQPAWLKFVPRPGPWMVTFKQAMAFVLLGTNVWLLKNLFDLTDGNMVVWTICFWCFVGFACWWIGKIGPSWRLESQLSTWVAALLLCAGGYWFSYVKMYRPAESDPLDVDVASLVSHPAPSSGGRAATTNGSVPSVAGAPELNSAGEPPPAPPVAQDGTDSDGAGDPLAPEAVLDALADRAVEYVRARGWENEIPWVPYRKGLAQRLSERGYTVYVDYTATWCASCKWNTSTVLETADIRGKMSAAGVIPVEADFTRRNPTMREEILSFQRSSVPLNLVYPAGRPDTPIVLPVLLTNGYVTDALNEAGPSTATNAQRPGTASAVSPAP